LKNNNKLKPESTVNVLVGEKKRKHGEEEDNSHQR
jgi:hypothetical protein